MKRNLVKGGLVIAAIIALALWLSRKNNSTTFDGPATITTPNNTVVVHQPGKPPVTIYQPQPGSTVITTDPHGNVTVKVKQFGVGFDPGIGVAVADRLRLTLDSRLLFYRRFGLNAGLALSLSGGKRFDDVVKPFVAVSYALPFKKLSNTSVYAGATFDKYIIAGVRVRL
jgi:hypothetical protein